MWSKIELYTGKSFTRGVKSIYMLLIILWNSTYYIVFKIYSASINILNVLEYYKVKSCTLVMQTSYRR